MTSVALARRSVEVPSSKIPFRLMEGENLTLELICARDITPIMSRSYAHWHRNYGRRHEQEKEASPLVPDEHGFTTIPVRGDLSDEVNLIGVYGMTINSDDHVWFSTNHLGLVHELDEQFKVVQQYDGSPIIHNFRDIRFKGKRAYVTDAGLAGDKGMLHVFSMPGFNHEQTITLGELHHPSPDGIYFHRDMIVIDAGCSKEVPSIGLFIVNPSDGSTRHVVLRDVSSVFEHRRRIYAIPASPDERTKLT